MKKLLLINSFGPMGSTLLAGLIEKFDYTIFPLRKLRLHQYLMQELDLKSKVMEQRLEQTMIDHAKPSLRGGVSVLDRENQKPSSLLDPKRIKNAKEKIKTLEYQNIQDLYFACRKIYTDCVIYKDIKTDANKQMELTVDIHRFNHKALYDAYQKEFDDVKMIHITRDFSGWINSLASQAFLHPSLKNRIKFFPHMRYRDYALYEEAIAEMPGLTINFHDLFQIPIEDLTQKIAAFLEEKIPDENLRKSTYDLYGKFQNYDVAFTPFDDKIEFLSLKTRNKFQTWADQKIFEKRSIQILSYALYLKDLCCFHIRRALKKK